MEHAPFDSGEESDIEEDEPDEPGAQNVSILQFDDENRARLASSSLADPLLAELEAQREVDKEKLKEKQKETNAADPHQL